MVDSENEVMRNTEKEIVVTPFSEEHLDAATQVFIQAFAGDPWNELWPFSSARRRVSDIVRAPGFVGVASFRGRDLVGFVLGRTEAYLDEEHFFLQEMCVLPELQGQGIGTTMLRHLHQRLVVAGCKQAYLLTARESGAERFYLQNGYRSARRTSLLVLRLE